MPKTKKEKDRESLQEYIDRFRKLDTNTLIQRLGIIIHNNFARQAINIILKEGGEL
jgi:hypothetical protein